MKKALLALISAALLGSTAMAADVVNLAIGEWAPFTSEKDPKGKLLEKVVTEAFKLEGVEVKYSYFPWKRSYNNVEDGTADGTFPWIKTPEREAAFITPKTPVLVDDAVYFHLKSKPFDWKTLDDLKKYKVGVTLGYKNEKIYPEKGIAAEVVNTEELNFKKIAAGRIDVYETSKAVGYATINKFLTPDEAKLITNHPKPVEQSEYFVFFSKKTPNGKAMSDKFESGLKKLKASGTYDKLMAQ